MANRYFQNFRISQSAILIRDNRALILQDAKPHRKWLLPGGHIDEHELAEEAFRREIKEELALGF